ncbi:MAG TPA: hypothetical protein VLX90_13845 [Steroidobacteraceae bacterium]|nr:hypothetical protein [Steroidobacteraceae bacterium]
MSVKRYLPLALLLTPAIVLAQESYDSIVQWNQLVGVITAPGVNNPVAGISAGAGPWSVHEGHARVDLTTGQASFEVHGLVLNGTNTSGTPGTIATVTGTLVCNAGTAQQAVRDTAEVKLTQQGDAHFRGEITAIPAPCANPVFLVRIGPSFPVAGAVGRWLATGAVRTQEAD